VPYLHLVERSEAQIKVGRVDAVISVTGQCIEVRSAPYGAEGFVWVANPGLLYAPPWAILTSSLRDEMLM
jgi:hypothetical protein